jgi:hypothetical protein
VGRVSRVRRSLSFENVLVTVVAFVVLAGGSAFAAGQLGKNSVGKKQLKANAVTTAKIKKNAVTAAKIRSGAIDASKVKDGSLAIADMNAADVPFGRVVHEALGTGPPASPPALPVIPLDKPTYTQEAGRDDTILGSADIGIPATCEPPWIVFGYVLLDESNPAEPAGLESAVAIGVYQDPKGTGPNNVRLNIGPSGPAGPLSPPAAVNHTMSALVGLSCKSGLQPGAVSNLSLEVIGVK